MQIHAMVPPDPRCGRGISLQVQQDAVDALHLTQGYVQGLEDQIVLNITKVVHAI